jgi:predicted DNA binding CopG/RHH family protein
MIEEEQEQKIKDILKQQHFQNITGGILDNEIS